MSMQSTCLERLGGEKVVNPKLQETTLIQQLFGGRLKSKVPFIMSLAQQSGTGTESGYGI